MTLEGMRLHKIHYQTFGGPAPASLGRHAFTCGPHGFPRESARWADLAGTVGALRVV